jgi:hypothetical protein
VTSGWPPRAERCSLASVRVRSVGLTPGTNPHQTAADPWQHQQRCNLASNPPLTDLGAPQPDPDCFRLVPLCSRLAKVIPRVLPVAKHCPHTLGENELFSDAALCVAGAFILTVLIVSGFREECPCRHFSFRTGIRRGSLLSGFRVGVADRSDGGDERYSGLLASQCAPGNDRACASICAWRLRQTLGGSACLQNFISPVTEL